MSNKSIGSWQCLVLLIGARVHVRNLGLNALNGREALYFCGRDGLSRSRSETNSVVILTPNKLDMIVITTTIHSSKNNYILLNNLARYI